MGAMSDLAAEREYALNEAHWAYKESFDALMTYQANHDINRRTLAEMEELGRLDSICLVKKMHYENAKSNRFRVTK